MITVLSMPVMSRTGDRDGRLILWSGALAAVITCLPMNEHPDIRGRWFLEIGFGLCNYPGELFDSPEHAAEWVGQRLSSSPPFTVVQDA